MSNNTEVFLNYKTSFYYDVTIEIAILHGTPGHITGF